MYQKIVSKKPIKLSVLIVSACFVLLNTSALRAQVTMMPDSSMSDTMTDMMPDADATESTATGSAGVPDPVTNPVEEEPTESGGGGGGGAIIGLLAVGAVVAIASSQKKKPTIQKTFAYEKDVSGADIFLMDFSSKSPFSQQQNWKRRLPELSMQFGSSSYAEPNSFMNFRLEKQFNSKVSLSSNLGIRSSQRKNNDFKSWQWLNIDIQAKDIFTLSDHLLLSANYTEGDDVNSSTSVLLHGNQFDQYKTFFLDRNTRFQLAYSKSVGENQRLGFQLSKDGTSDRSDEHYRVQLVWQNAF